MKKLVLTMVAGLLIGITTLKAQGINFAHGSWKEILSTAKAQNKLVFVDVYTSWCGPCKKMAAEVFPLKEVGDKFNSSFINYKIDAEKGEGVQIAKTFRVNSFPTYLFVDGDGQLIYRSGGSSEAFRFLKEAETALKEQHDPKKFLQWESEYQAGKRDKDFLIGYLKKRAALELPSDEIIEQLFPMLQQKELEDKVLMSSMIYFGINLSFLPKGKFYQYVVAHFQDIDALLGNQQGFSLDVLRAGIMVYFKNNIIAHKKETMLPLMIEANNELLGLMGSERTVAANKELVMNYYSGVHHEEKLRTAAMDYVNYLLKVDVKALRLQDADDLKKMREPYLSGKEDSAKVENWSLMNQMVGETRIRGLALSIRDVAEAVYRGSKDQKLLMQAVAWARKSEEYLPGFSTEAVYSALLMKTGKKQEAIAMMQKAATDPVMEMVPDLKNLMLENVEKIKAGVEPDQLWHR